MITEDKQITTPEYWNKVYAGTSTGKVDNSKTTRPANVFDRFAWVAGFAEGPNILGVASGHAHIEKRIKALHPDWIVYASDQADSARPLARCEPYYIFSAYKIPFDYKMFNTIICCQALEYMDDQVKFFKEAERVSEKLLITVPIGEMQKWSQLRIYTEQSVRSMLNPFGDIEIFERQGDLLLVRLKFNWLHYD